MKQQRIAAALAVGVGLALATAGCGSDAPPRTPPVMDTVVWQATGDGRAADAPSYIFSVRYSLSGKPVDEGDPAAKLGYGLPFTATDTVTHAPDRAVAMRAAGSPDEQVSCTATVNGVTVVSQTGLGSATCQWSGPTPY